MPEQGAGKRYAFTRDQLIEVLTNAAEAGSRLGFASAEALVALQVDALISALEDPPPGECQAPEVRYVQSADRAVSGDNIS